MSIARPRVAAAVLAAATVLASSVTAVSVLVPAPASAAVTGAVESGSASWGTSTYLASANFGRPNPLPEAYTAPAVFDATTRVSTFGGATGTVAPDGGAVLSFTGGSVNFAKTSGAWLRLSDLRAELDASGNGTLSASVSYGQSTTGVPPALTFDPAQAPQRATERVDVVDLTGNTAADRTTTPTSAAWTGLDGAWAPELISFLAGDADADPAVPAFVYAGQVNGTTDRTPLPLDISVATAAPQVSAAVTDTSPATGVTVGVTGTGFRGVTHPGDAGVYVGIAPSGGLPDVSSIEGIDGFAAAAYRPAPSIVDGGFTADLTAPPEALDPAETYSVYTWQAHTHSNTTQDTETPLDIDFAALEQATTTTTASGATTRRYGVASTLTAAVDAPGTVTLTGVGRAQTAAVDAGTATFTVPAGLAAGRYTATLAYGGGPAHLPSQATRTLVVTKATPRTRLTVTRKPTAGPRGRAGKARVVVTGPATVAAPTGRVTLRLTKPGARARTVAGRLSRGAVVLAVPKVARGTWTVVATYAGAVSFASSKQTRKLAVR